MRSIDDYFNSFHEIEVGVCVDSERPTRHAWLVKIMICRVGNIQFKRGRGVIWITIKIGKIIVIRHITQEILKTNKEK